jgi:hypothetical protein
MKIGVHPVTYSKRLTYSLLEPVIVGIVIFAIFRFVYDCNQITCLIVIGIAALIFIRRFYWYKYFLQSVQVGEQENSFELIFFIFNKKKKLIIPAHELTIIEDQAFVRGKLKKLVFNHNGKVLLVQYEQFGWTKEKLSALYYAWKKAQGNQP